MLVVIYSILQGGNNSSYILNYLIYGNIANMDFAGMNNLLVPSYTNE